MARHNSVGTLWTKQSLPRIIALVGELHALLIVESFFEEVGDIVHYKDERGLAIFGKIVLEMQGVGQVLLKKYSQ